MERHRQLAVGFEEETVYAELYRREIARKAAAEEAKL
jgi:hypothetical protein